MENVGLTEVVVRGELAVASEDKSEVTKGVKPADTPAPLDQREQRSKSRLERLKDKLSAIKKEDPNIYPIW